MAIPPSSAPFVPALLVIDMQHDFVHGSLAVPGAPQIIDVVNKLLSFPFASKIGTKDFHPSNHISFAATHRKPEFSKITIYPPGGTEGERALEQVLWPVHCVASTPGSEFVHGFNHEALDIVVHKGTHPDIESYSAFRDPWHLSNTELPDLLQARGVTDVFIAGLAGDYCVKCSAIDSVLFGYKTWVIQDAIRSVSDTGSEWEVMEKEGILELDSIQTGEMLRNYSIEK
ncbi:Isochorismatase-like protein [Collybia nuda]|uniref:nicotinamidase n=1 Tax=Collybia nuda TaxID=64659 RepID=A0A9P6CKP5_9AGAR|nr:Isochorismatase-like protein [Collybia nuda]